MTGQNTGKKKLSMNVQLLLASVVGVSAGLLTQAHLMPFPEQVSFIAQLLGTLFTSLLKMVVMPLIFFTVTTSILHLKAHHRIQKVWQWTFGFFACSALIAAATGLVFANWIQPGVGLSIDWLHATSTTAATLQHPSQWLLGFVSDSFQNPIASLAANKVFPAVIFAIFLGIALMALDQKVQHVTRVVEELVQIMMWLVQQIMKLAPLGVMGLLYHLAATQSLALFQQLGVFIVLVFAATLWHGFINIPAMLFVLTRKNPFAILWQSQRSLWTAFSTSSSSATLPVTLDIVQNKLKVDRSIGTFVSTIGSTVNMDGTVLYEAMAALFVANLLGIHLSLVQQGMVMVMASVAAIGAPGIPSAGMVTLILVLQSVGLPAEAVALLLPIDRLLDTVRTMVNVEGDIVGSVIVHHRVKGS